MALFDVALHYNFFHAAEAGSDYDMRTLLDRSLISERPTQAVTFVDNHDTQMGQSLQSFVADWFKQLAYAIILLRQEGLPCVFYTDYYGNPAYKRPLVPNLGKMIRIRHSYVYGEQKDYFDDEHTVGWVRQGDTDHNNSAIAVVLNNSEVGTKQMEMGTAMSGVAFYDALGSFIEPVVIDSNGYGIFQSLVTVSQCGFRKKLLRT